MLPQWSLATGVMFNIIEHRWSMAANQSEWSTTVNRQFSAGHLNFSSALGDIFIPVPVDFSNNPDIIRVFLAAPCLLPWLPGCMSGGWGCLVRARECQHLQHPGELREGQLLFCFSFSAKEQRGHLDPAVQSLGSRVHRAGPSKAHTCITQCSLHSSLPGPLGRSSYQRSWGKKRSQLQFAKENHWGSRGNEMQSQKESTDLLNFSRLEHPEGGKQPTSSSREVTFWVFHSKCLTSAV